MSVSVHCCRALRAIPHESFWGPYPGPLNKYLYTINCAFVSVHHHRSSARAATPMQGVAINLQQYNVVYDGDNSVYMYQLRRDLEAGDLVIQ